MSDQRTEQAQRFDLGVRLREDADVIHAYVTGLDPDVHATIVREIRAAADALADPSRHLVSTEQLEQALKAQRDHGYYGALATSNRPEAEAQYYLELSEERGAEARALVGLREGGEGSTS